MYLTKVPAKLNHYSVMAAFEVVESDTPRSALGILFRVDGGATVIQSSVPPQQLEGAIVKHYVPPVVDGETYIFRLALNSISRLRGKDLYIDPIEWLARRDFGAEFDVRSVEQSPSAERSKGHCVMVNHCILEGVLIVTDAAKLKDSIGQGIGRGKAWGCGLLSILPVNT